MVGTLTRPAAEVEPAGTAWWEMLTICLPDELKLADALPEQLGFLDRGWTIERGHHGELMLTMASGEPGGVGDGQMYAEARGWTKGDGGEIATEWSAGFDVVDAEGGAPMRHPDLSWISEEQLEATVGAPPREGFGILCPAFAVEVRSPGNPVAAQRRRMADWIRFGTQQGWLIDPQGRSVWVDRPGHEPERLDRPPRLTGESVMPGFALDFDPIWAMPDRGDQVAAEAAESRTDD